MTKAVSKEPLWLREDVIRAIHKRLLAEHGGAEGVREHDLLASALARPKALWHYGKPRPTLPELAAAYAFGIARNHPLIDGNKRTAFVACRLFLMLNGQDLKASREKKLAVFMALANGSLSQEQLALWIREHAAKR